MEENKDELIQTENEIKNKNETEAVQRKIFGKGIVIGVLSAVLVGFGASALHACLSNKHRELSQLNDASKAPVSSSMMTANDTEEVIDEELIAKLGVLEQCAQEFFLFDTADAQTFKDSIYKGFMDALGDPYSCYYTKDEYEDLMESTSGSYEGIGVVVSQNIQTKIITVVRPFEGCPGAQAGMLPGDIIISVGGNEVGDTDVSTVVSWIKGEEGTSVDIRVYRESDEQYHDFSVERRNIEVPTVEYEMLEDSIGYVQVTEFDEVTAQQYEEAVEELKAQGMKGLIVDVRDNPGGLLTCVVEMLDYMLPEGTIVYTEDKNGEGESYSSDAERYFDLPLAILVNGNSASASEIFSGAIQDYAIGTIVGTQTFGKGIVQSLLPFNDGSAIKLTVSRYFTPRGTCIHEEGITPDVEVELDEELKTKLTVEKKEDNQLQKAIETIEAKIAAKIAAANN